VLFAAFFIAPITAPAPKPSPATAAVFLGGPAALMALVTRPLGFDPDGNARWLVVTSFYDARGNPTRILANSDFDWRSPDGHVQWQTRLRFGQPSAVLSTTRDGPLTMRVHANYPNLGSLTVSTDTRRWPQPRVVAQALGPYAVAIGWFPRQTRTVRVVRYDERNRRTNLAVVAAPSSSFRDDTVLPNRTYRYVVMRGGAPPISIGPVATPPLPAATAAADVAGKGMWLFFTDNPVDSIYYKTLDPGAIVRRAAEAGLRYVELRVAYGAYWEIAPEAKPTIDAIVDGLAARGIATIAWTVPRETTFEDVQTSVRAASYRTAAGTPMGGLALDLERGGDFMGGAPQGTAALWQYAALVRKALGPKYLIVADVEDPYLERLDDRSYPYAAIARYATVLQPMAYWRMLGRRPLGAAGVTNALRNSYATLLQQAGRRVAVSVGGQTSGEGPAGQPPADEILASLRASKRLGAIGECFFAWDGTQRDQWEALKRFQW
jgi:hypothetical protein